MSTKNVFLKCNCNAETAVFTRYDFGLDTEYELSIEDSYCGHDYMGITGRLKRAWHALLAKPVSYTGIYCADYVKMKKFFEDCLSLMSAESE